MTESMLESVQKEREILWEEIKKTKAYQKVALLDNLIAAYGGKVSKSMGAVSGRKGKSVRDTVDDLAIECIEANDGKATKVQIGEYLAANGLEMSNPNLAAYLSASKRVDYDGEVKAWVVV